mmetsp:Transcript_13081/g.24451  ORF Transcript_13081/g.24451 Transcript_13081/m.24451 type:complete len:430 (-) Transcript_13081:207-1496(-)
MNAQLFILCLVNATVCSMYTLITPFYPQRAEEAGVSMTLIGFIFALNPLGQVVSCLPTGYYLKQIGRRRGIVAAIAIMSLSLFLLGAVDMCDYSWFLALSIASRFIGGLASGIFGTILMAIISSNFTDSLQIALMYMEVSAGLGLLIGPAVGSLFYYIGGYYLPFIVLGTYFAMCTPAVYWLLGPDREYIEKNKDMNAWVLVKKSRILLDMLCIALLLHGIGVYAPIIAIHYQEYGANAEEAAMLTVIGTVSYMICSTIVAKYSGKVDFHITIASGLFVQFISYYLMGPLYPAPQHIALVIIGQTLSGLGFALVYIPILPSMLRSSTDIYGYAKDDKLSDALSSLMNLISSVGEIVGSIIGGALYQYYGDQAAYGSVSFLCLFWFFAYYHLAYNRRGRGLLSRTQQEEAAFELKSSLKAQLITETKTLA